MAKTPSHHSSGRVLRRSARGSSRRFADVLVLLVVLALAATACRVEGEATITGSGESEIGTPGGAEPGTNSAEDPGPNVVTADDDASADLGPTDVTMPEAPESPPSELPRALTVAAIDCQVAADSAIALNDQGEVLYAEHVEAAPIIPEYALVVDIDPLTGAVAGAMRAVVPAQERSMNFRVFAGMNAFNAGLVIDNVTVNGERVEATLDTALLSVPAPASADQTSVVELDFSFTIDQMAANDNIFGALTGESLQPDAVGLLGRTDTGMQLGHWFPVWLPEGIRTDPDPSGFGDIGAFPAANICATITVPAGYQVVTGGARIDTTDSSVVEAGAGLRDFSILVSNDLLVASRVVDGVEIKVWGPSANPDALTIVLDYSDQSLRALTEAFGPYPWDEIDVISAPLGAGVGGMEWPGAIWIEQSMFAGRLPGLGSIGDLFSDEEFDELFEMVGGPAVATSLEWTIAHEFGHEWWHATVGNDSIESPAVDEPLAQFAACLAMERIHPDSWREICDAQTIGQYAQARALGIADTAAEQPSDQFASSIQYGAVVYGKAPGFYYAAGDLLGWDALVASLRSFVAENAFSLVSTDALREHLVEDAGDQGPEIAILWDRWFREARGDEDIDVTASAGLSGGLGGFEGLEGLDLAELFGDEVDFESLLGEDFDIEGLLGDDVDLEELFGEDLDIDELLQDFLDATGPDE